MIKNLLANARDVTDMGLIPVLGRSPEKGMTTRSSILAWRIPWTEESAGTTVHSAAQSQTQLKQLSTHAGFLLVCQLCEQPPK